MIFQLGATAHPSSADDSRPREWLKHVQGGTLLTHAQGLRAILALYTAGTKDEDNSDRVNGVDDSSGRDGVTQECLALVLSIRCVLTTVILKFNRMRFSRFWLLDL
jgi:hypothetical protein